MPESLFRPRRFRRSYLAACFAGAVLIEASMVGVAAIWPRQLSWKIPDQITEIDTGPVLGEPVQELILPKEDPVPTPEPPEPTPPPEDTPEPDTPPPTEEPEMSMDTPVPTPPPKKPAFTRPAGPAPSNAKRGDVPQNGVVGGVPKASKTTGTPGAARLGVRKYTPKPPYPYQARKAHLTGSGVCHVTFDASGRVSSATMTQSIGSGILDSNTVSYARANWTGPPNGALDVPITYQLQ